MTDHLSAFKVIREEAKDSDINEINMKVVVKRNKTNKFKELLKPLQKLIPTLSRIVFFKANVWIVITSMLALGLLAGQVSNYRYQYKEPKWHKVSEGNDGLSVEVDDTSIVTTSGPNVRFWTNFEFKNPLKIPKEARIIVGGHTVWTTEEYWEANCNDKTLTEVDITYRDKDGHVLADNQHQLNTSPSYVSPHALMYSVLNYACSKAFK